MVYDALQLITDELNSYLKDPDGGGNEDNPVTLGNIALSDSNGKGRGNNSGSLDNRVVVSLVNIQEEKTLKNQPAVQFSGEDSRYKNPPVITNLFVLFSATHKDYNNAVMILSRVIAFFQGKNVFTHRNTPIPSVTPAISAQEFRLILDLYSLSFEEVNHLWGALGGKQMPSVLYRVRLTRIEREATKETRGVVKQVRMNNKET